MEYISMIHSHFPDNMVSIDQSKYLLIDYWYFMYLTPKYSWHLYSK